MVQLEYLAVENTTFEITGKRILKSLEVLMHLDSDSVVIHLYGREVFVSTRA